MIRILCLIMIMASPALAETLNLQGLPIQMEWGDVNGDDQPDLVALMLVSQTEGAVETWFVDGRLRGVYEDHTLKEKYLATWIKTDGSWREQDRVELGRETVLGFALDGNKMMLWGEKGLTAHQWSDEGWRAGSSLPTPGLLAAEGIHMNEFPFWQQGKNGPVWVVPDLDGVHVTPFNQPEAAWFRPYPDSSFTYNRESTTQQTILVAMPAMKDINGDTTPEMVFRGYKSIAAWSLDETGPTYGKSVEGRLVDLNNDGLVDLVKETEGDIEKRKDLPKVKTKLEIHYATGPLTFPEEADLEQSVSGLLVETDDDEIPIPYPYLDLNNDGLKDVAGMAFKVSLFQIAKVVTTQRITIKFLLNLSLQREDGTFELLAGGPYEMTWKINLRRLRMPTFAQMAADFDGDGWMDILMEKKNKYLEVTPVTRAGFQTGSKWTRKLPSQLRDPDQVYGRDMNGDGKAEFVVMKIKGGQTLLAILEGK